MLKRVEGVTGTAKTKLSMGDYERMIREVEPLMQCVLETETTRRLRSTHPVRVIRRQKSMSGDVFQTTEEQTLCAEIQRDRFGEFVVRWYSSVIDRRLIFPAYTGGIPLRRDAFVPSLKGRVCDQQPAVFRLAACLPLSAQSHHISTHSPGSTTRTSIPFSLRADSGHSLASRGARVSMFIPPVAVPRAPAKPPCRDGE
jgi:hypothetical protein